MKIKETYDLIVLGGGPAGLAAAVYGGRARLKTLVLEKGNPGGRARTTREIVNYTGILSSGGEELSRNMMEHAEKFGAHICREEVKSVELSEDIKIVETRRHIYEAKAVIIATGTSPRVLGIPGERELAGLGVAYCATCDAEFFKDQTVVVVGSGDQGIEESMYIAKFAKEVKIIVLHQEGVLDCNRQAAEAALSHPKLNFVWNSVLDSICGCDEVTGVRIKNIQTGEITEVNCQGVFFFVGMIPNTDLFKGKIKLNDKGWILTNDRMETDCPGVYAAGDVRDKYLRQICTGVADGAIAATAAQRYLEELEYCEKNILQREEPVLVIFWSPELEGSMEILNQAEEQNRQESSPCYVVEIDVSRKKYLAAKLGIQLSVHEPAIAVIVSKGKVCKKLDLQEKG